MEKSLVKNAADASQVKEAKDKSRSARERELDDIASIGATPPGRRMLWRYLGLCGVFKTSMTGDNQTFFLEGQRNIGLQLLADINEASPELYMQMLNENMERNRSGKKAGV